MTDEGLGGIAVHVANDRPEPLSARLRIALYRDGEIPVGDVDRPHRAARTWDGGTQRRDAARSVRRCVVGLPLRTAGAGPGGRQPGDPRRRPGAAALAGDALPGRAARRRSRRPSALGLEAELAVTRRRRRRATRDGRDPGTEAGLRGPVRGARLGSPSDDAFSIEPGHARRIRLRPTVVGTPFRGGRLTAINLAGAHEIAVR